MGNEVTMTPQQEVAIDNLIAWVAAWRRENVGQATIPVVVAAEQAIYEFGGPKPPWRD